MLTTVGYFSKKDASKGTFLLYNSNADMYTKLKYRPLKKRTLYHGLNECSTQSLCITFYRLRINIFFEKYIFSLLHGGNQKIMFICVNYKLTTLFFHYPTPDVAKLTIQLLS